MSGYTSCACRDCFDVAIADDAQHLEVVGEAFCWACKAAGCDGDADCERCQDGSCSHDSCAEP